ncbi:MAG TPA: M42 family metallopeptidase [Firmicutes bacterium]|nr:M42 family metallopeptidase [Bacillota bacterium]
MEINFDSKAIIEVISDLVKTPSPSGFTDRVISQIEAYLNELGLPSWRNRKGGLLTALPGQDSSKQRMITAHLDTLGAMVKEVKSDGRLKLSLIGGSRWNHLEGEYCQIFSADQVYTGTILMHQTSVHVYKDAGTAERNSDNMEVRLDEKVESADDVKKLGISVGDFVAFDPRTVITPGGFIKSRHLDDKASAGILLYMIKVIKENNVSLPHTTHILFSNHEEVGYGGNSNVPAEVVEYLAVDMGAIGDGQASDEYSVCICAMDSTGPYNHHLRQRLVELAKAHDLSYKVDIYPNYGSDASAALRAGHDLIHGLIGPGIDASHAFERTHVDAITNTAKLIYYYLLSPIAGD